MTVLTRFASAGAVALLAVTAVSPAMAASVNKSAFDSQLKAAVSKAQVAPKGMAVSDTQVMSISEPKMSFSSSKVMNPNGSFKSKSTFLGSTQTRCVTKTTCYLTADGGKNWRQVSPTDKGLTRVDDTLAYYSALQLSPAATFDVSGNTFTVKDKATTMVTVVTGSTVVTTVELSNPSNPSETATMVITHKPVKPVKVAKPKGVVSGIPSSKAPSTARN